MKYDYPLDSYKGWSKDLQDWIGFTKSKKDGKKYQDIIRKVFPDVEVTWNPKTAWLLFVVPGLPDYILTSPSGAWLERDCSYVRGIGETASIRIRSVLEWRIRQSAQYNVPKEMIPQLCFMYWLSERTAAPPWFWAVRHPHTEQYVKDGTLDEETFAKWTRLVGCGDLPLAGTWVNGHR